MGSPFVYIGSTPSGGVSNQNLVTWQYDSAYYGKTIYFKFLSFNTLGARKKTLAQVSPYAFALQDSARGARP